MYHSASRVVRRSWRWACLTILSGLSLMACAPNRLPPGGVDPSDPIRFHTWEDYYERGRRRILAGRIQAACEDFEVCLGLRKGARRKNDVDDWRVRTHGMHMFNGYFPNRELGICYYFKGDLTNALRYLNRSASQTPSSRSAFYINKIHADRVSAVPVPRPQIALATTNRAWTSNQAFEVAGTARGAGKIAHIRVQGEPLPIELAKTNISFLNTVALRAGTNRIRVEAEDLKGQRSSEEVIVYADWERPQLSVRRVDQTTSGWDVDLVCADAGGLETLSYNATSLLLQSGARHQAHRVSIEAGSGAAFTARDVAGNTLQVDLRTMLALHASATEGRDRSDRNRDASHLPSTQNGLEQRPSIFIQQTQAVDVVHTDRFFIDGTVVSTNGLVALTINGKDLLLTKGPDAQRTRFSTFCALCEGTNTLHVVATDTLGQTQTNSLTVVHAPPVYVRTEYRLAASVPPLYASRNQADGYAWQVRLVEALLARKHQRFNLLTTDAEDLAALAREVELRFACTHRPASLCGLRSVECRGSFL